MVQQATTRMISRETEGIAGNYRLREWAIKNRVTNVVTLRTLTDSDEGLTLETSAFESLYGGQFTLSTQLIKPNLSRYTSHRRRTTVYLETCPSLHDCLP